jgi:hypothetical protein
LDPSHASDTGRNAAGSGTDRLVYTGVEVYTDLIGNPEKTFSKKTLHEPVLLSILQDRYCAEAFPTWVVGQRFSADHKVMGQMCPQLDRIHSMGRLQ